MLMSSDGTALFNCQVCITALAKGYHFGAYTCEGCKSFFGRTCKPLKKRGDQTIGIIGPRLNECKNGGKCNVQGRNRTACKSCRYKRCIQAGMSPQNSRYGRRSKYFKVSSLIDAQEKARLLVNDHHRHSNHDHSPIISSPSESSAIIDTTTSQATTTGITLLPPVFKPLPLPIWTTVIPWLWPISEQPQNEPLDLSMKVLR